MALNLEPRKCDECSGEYKPKRKKQRFCSPLCRRNWYRKKIMCPYCGKMLLGLGGHLKD